jgi:hypothetical protein
LIKKARYLRAFLFSATWQTGLSNRSVYIERVVTHSSSLPLPAQTPGGDEIERHGN